MNTTSTTRDVTPDTADLVLLDHSGAGCRPVGDRVTSSAAQRLTEEFVSGDPVRVWAAATSVARIAVQGERWVDDTAYHEACCGAWDAVTEPGWSGFDRPLPAALAGARRALRLERRARTRLATPARPRRRDPNPAAGFVRLVPLSEASSVAAGSGFQSRPSRWMVWVGSALTTAGWRWPVDPAEALLVTLDAVVRVGRDGAAAEVRRVLPELPPATASGLVILLAGSRQRDRNPWPGAVWLNQHGGLAAVQTDPGVASAVRAVAVGHRAGPGRVVDSAVHRSTTRGRATGHDRLATVGDRS